MPMLDQVKLAIPVKTDYYDSEIKSLIQAAVADLGIVGIDTASETVDPLITRAIITYVKLHFGEPANYDRLRESYDEQKAQLITATGYGL